MQNIKRVRSNSEGAQIIKNQISDLVNEGFQNVAESQDSGDASNKNKVKFSKNKTITSLNRLQTIKDKLIHCEIFDKPSSITETSDDFSIEDSQDNLTQNKSDSINNRRSTIYTSYNKIAINKTNQKFDSTLAQKNESLNFND